MNKAETIQVLSYLATNYQEIAKKNEQEKQLMVATWLDCFKDYDYDVVMKAVRELMQSSMFVPKLAEIINLSKQYKQAIINNIPKLKAGKCNKCNGEGLIFYKKIISGYEYLYAARCNCEKGMEFSYDGRTIQDEKHRSNYYISTIEQIGM